MMGCQISIIGLQRNFRYRHTTFNACREKPVASLGR